MSLDRNFIRAVLLLFTMSFQSLPANSGAPPSTQPAVPQMVNCTDKAVGVNFDRTSDWTCYDGAKNGKARVSFVAPSALVGQIYAHMQFWMEDTSSFCSIDTTSPASSGTLADIIFTGDGVPARLTVQGGPACSEDPTVQTAKGTRHYVLQI